VAAAEMAFAGGLGARLELDNVPRDEGSRHPAVLLFGESNTRFLCEVRPDNKAAFESQMLDVPFAHVGGVVDSDKLGIFRAKGIPVIQADLAALKAAWQRPLWW